MARVSLKKTPCARYQTPSRLELPACRQLSQADRRAAHYRRTLGNGRIQKCLGPAHTPVSGRGKSRTLYGN